MSPKSDKKIRNSLNPDRVILYSWQPPTLKAEFRESRSLVVDWEQDSEGVLAILKKIEKLVI